MISLQGHIEATYHEMVAIFGDPTYIREVGDLEDKVNTEWEFAGYNWYGEETPIIVYDWKDYDNGATSRSGQVYQWHIGGEESCVVEIVNAKVENYRKKV